jgi:hypothetical protein
LDLVAAAAVVVAVSAFEAFVGEPTPKFHTLRTIDLAEDRILKRGVALPLSIPRDPPPLANRITNSERGARTKDETYCSQPAVQHGSP